MARRVAGIPGPNKIDPRKYDYRELHAVHFDGLFWADEKRPRILDLGCGTGIWALEMSRYVVILPSVRTANDCCGQRWYRNIDVGLDRSSK